MTQPNQSELDEVLNDLFLRGERLGRSLYVSDDERHDAVKNVSRYITSNYTPNSEVAECKRTAIFKTIQTLVKAGAISDRAASSALVLLTKLKEVK